MNKNNKDGGKRPNVRLYITAAVTFILIFGLYRIVVYLVSEQGLDPRWFTVLMWTYLSLAGVLFIAVVILNRGLDAHAPTADELPDEWDYEKKREFMESDAKRRKISKKLLMPCISFVIVFIFEIVEIYYFPAIYDWYTNF